MYSVIVVIIRHAAQCPLSNDCRDGDNGPHSGIIFEPLNANEMTGDVRNIAAMSLVSAHTGENVGEVTSQGSTSSCGFRRL